MRENTKVILWIVVVAFVVTIFAVWGLDLQTGQQGGDPNLVGKVNGVSITRAQYQTIYQQIAQQYRASSQSQALSYTQEQFIHDQAWDNVIYNVIVRQEVERLGIKASDDEILAYLRTSPPPEIRQYFVDEQGNFDAARYQRELNNPENDWTNLEQLVRERIPTLKLNQYLTSQVHVSEEEVRHAYEVQAIDLKIAYVTFDLADIDLEGYQPSEEDISRYYNEHTNEFKKPKTASVELVQIPLDASTADHEAALETAKTFRRYIREGEEFGSVAKTYSEAPTSFVDGNTGFISRPRRDAAYFDALDNLAGDEISEPVLTPDGYYVLKLLEKRTESDNTEYNVQEILVKTSPSSTTTDKLYELARSVRDRAAEAGLAEAAEENSLSVVSPPPFAETDVIGAIGFVPAISRFAFTSDPGTVSGILRDEKSLFIAVAGERVAPQTSSLEEVRGVIPALLTNERRKSLAERDARAFYIKARNGDFDGAAATYNKTVQRPETFKGTDNVDTFGPNSALADAALLLPPGEFTKAIEVNSGFVILQLVERSEMDAEDYKARIPGIREQMRGQKHQAFVSSWYDKLKASSQIEDLRTQS